jgi:hypothetical protein
VLLLVVPPAENIHVSRASLSIASSTTNLEQMGDMGKLGNDNNDLFNIDEEDDFEKSWGQLKDPKTTNFAVIFDAHQSHSRSNLSPDEVSTCLESRKSEANNGNQCLWLNLWGWQPEHHEIIKLIAHHYDVSPRLTHVICPVQQTAQAVMLGAQNLDPAQEKVDLEENSTSSSQLDPDPAPVSQKKHRMPSSMADIAEDLWHFNTVDYGQRYVCICWNALFFLPDTSREKYNGKPNAIRIWSSLLLCDDGTVVSTFELPSDLDQNALRAIRNNQVNVFTHLSRYGAARANDNMLMQINIRPFHSSVSNNSIPALDFASLLFYYLFDDWVNIYYQVVGGENSYRNQLDKLRQEMMDSPNVSQIKALHNIGRQLVVLKAVYRSYQTIIERIVMKQRHLTRYNSILSHQLGTGAGAGAGAGTGDGTGAVTRVDSDLLLPMANNGAFDINELSESKIRLANNAIVFRFERLLDRISLCAITEVEECQKEKDDMVMMVSLFPAISLIGEHIFPHPTPLAPLVPFPSSISLRLSLPVHHLSSTNPTFVE